MLLDYPAEQNTWEPLSNLQGCLAMVEEYEKKRISEELEEQRQRKRVAEEIKQAKEERVKSLKKKGMCRSFSR